MIISSLAASKEDQDAFLFHLLGTGPRVNRLHHRSRRQKQPARAGRVIVDLPIAGYSNAWFDLKALIVFALLVTGSGSPQRETHGFPLLHVQLGDLLGQPADPQNIVGPLEIRGKGHHLPGTPLSSGTHIATIYLEVFSCWR